MLASHNKTGYFYRDFDHERFKLNYTESYNTAVSIFTIVNAYLVDSSFYNFVPYKQSSLYFHGVRCPCRGLCLFYGEQYYVYFSRIL